MQFDHRRLASRLIWPCQIAENPDRLPIREIGELDEDADSSLDTTDACPEKLAPAGRP